jgi:phage terminase large subunit-like protein
VAKRYARDVVSGKIVACGWVTKACRRHLDDLKHGHERGLVFDEVAAQRALDFIAQLNHSKGEWANQQIKLEPWEQFITWNMFGWMRSEHPRWVIEKDGQREDTAGTRRFRTAYIEVARKNGKALALDTPIPTPDGWTTMGNIRVGEMVFDEQGNQCRVIRATETMYGHKCYRVVFSDKTSIVADADHQWRTERRRTNRPHGKRWRENDYIQTTEQIRQTITVGHKKIEWNHRIKCANPLEISHRKLTIPPYVLGAWLGDGNADSARITCSDKDIEIIQEIEHNGVSVRRHKTKNRGCGLYLLGSKGKSQTARDQSMQADLRRMGVLGKKFIPMVYLRSSRSQRMELLRGLMDTDGYISKKGQCEFTTTNEAIRDGFLELTRSLGYKPQCKTDRAMLYGVDCGPKYRIQFWAFSDVPVFHLERKLSRQKPKPLRRTRQSNRQIVAVEPVPSVPVRCIEVDSPAHLYLAGDGMIPTHNSTWAAAVMLYLAFADSVSSGEPGAESFSCATKRDQARIVHGEAVRMVRKSPMLRKNISIYKDNLNRIDMAQKFEPLGMDADTADGLNVHAALHDELHAHKSRDMWDVIETATGARRQPMIIAITTAGNTRQGVCWEKHEYTCRILDGVVEDDSWFGIIYTLDEKDDWRDESVWIKSNPNLGVSKKWSDMRIKAERARSMTSALNAFLQKELNVWVQGETKWMNMEMWRKCGGPLPALELPEFLIGRPCYSALDLSSTNDITAQVNVFPPLTDDEPIYVVCRFFIPEDNMLERCKNDGVPYDVWVREGYITATPGNTIDYDFILESFEKDAEQFQVMEIPYDRWNAEYLRQMLEKRGLDMAIFPFGQGFISMSPPMKELERLVASRKLAHGNNPVLTWMADNLIARTDPAGNIKPDKEKSREKIDGIVALLMGLDRCLKNQGEGESVYGERGIRTL